MYKVHRPLPALGRRWARVVESWRGRKPFRAQISTDDGGTDTRWFGGQNTQPYYL